MEQLLARLEEYRQMVDAALDDFLPRADMTPATLHEAMRYATLGGGKRIRPALVLMTGELFGVANADAMPAACAIEIVHTYSLVHDDLPAMDNDDLRRGRLTCHKAYDEATAILVGDALLTLAFGLLASRYPPPVAVDLIQIVARAAGHAGMISGQYMDLEGERRRLDDRDTIELMYALKTSELFVAACRVGARLGGAKAEATAKVAAFGKDVGLLFQTVDDILDETASAEQLGKNVRQDAAAGKSTIIMMRGVVGAQDQAAVYAKRADDNLADFGAAAATLRLLPQYLLTRQK
ncbi:farnesyl-diphosphate synthase [Planctomycetales bacterium]|nr:farnesyl-diphosphate synthase [Planctomycetales bacterium]